MLSSTKTAQYSGLRKRMTLRQKETQVSKSVQITITSIAMIVFNHDSEVVV
jgi:hypothetical protein